MLSLGYKHTVAGGVDRAASAIVRVRVIASDSGSSVTERTLSEISQQLTHVNLVWWSHPTEPPDSQWYTSTLCVLTTGTSGSSHLTELPDSQWYTSTLCVLTTGTSGSSHLTEPPDSQWYTSTLCIDYRY